MEFNRIIKLLRKERGITQKQAAEDLGVSQALLSHYEKVIHNGKRLVKRKSDGFSAGNSAFLSKGLLFLPYLC